MSIDEVMDAAVDYSNASWLDQDKARDALIAAIVLHVAEAVQREREECAKACESQAARWRPDQRRVYVSYECAAAIRARAEEETT